SIQPTVPIGSRWMRLSSGRSPNTLANTEAVVRSDEVTLGPAVRSNPVAWLASGNASNASRVNLCRDDMIDLARPGHQLEWRPQVGPPCGQFNRSVWSCWLPGRTLPEI